MTNILLTMSVKKSRIRETKHLSTDADSSNDTTVGRTKNTRKPNFFEKRKKSIKTRKLKNVQRYAKISYIPFNQSLSLSLRTFFARRFQTISKQKFSNVRPLLSITFPQGFRISKYFGHPTSGSGGKIGLKIYHMKRDIRQTDTRTSRLLDRIGPVGRFDENFNALQPISCPIQKLFTFCIFSGLLSV